jgi:hypothetical protein
LKKEGEEMSRTTIRVLLVVGIGVLGLLLLWWLLNPRQVASPGEEPANGNTNVNGDATDGDTAIQCPVATPELFTVEPVTSPTDELTQIITVDLGLGEAITITTESGTFTAPFDEFPKEIEISLLPNTTHNLTVEGRVQQVFQGDCVYGGYTLRTTTDRNGEPLVIEQQQ